MINYNIDNPMNAFLNSAGGMQRLQSNQMAIDNAIAEKQAQQQAAQQQADIMSQFGQLDFSNQEQLQQFIQQNPQMLEKVKSVSSFGDSARNKQALEAATQFDRALSSGNPELIESTISAIAPIIDNNGDPTFTSDTVRQMAQTPQGIQQLKLMSQGYIAELGGKDYLSQTALTPQQQQQNRFKQQELGLQREKFNFDKQMKKLDFDLKKAERQYKQAQGTAKEQEAQFKLEQAQLKADEAKSQDQERIQGEIVNSQKSIANVNDILNSSDILDSVSGFANLSKVPELAMTPTQKKARSYFENVKNNLTIKNLGAMQGPLTDSDVRIIASAASRLDYGMSEAAIKKELDLIKNTYDAAINKYEKEAARKGYEIEQQNTAKYKVGQTARNPQTGEVMIFTEQGWVKQ